MQTDTIYIVIQTTEPSVMLGELEAIAICRVDRRGVSIAAFADTISSASDFKTIWERIRTSVLSPAFSKKYTVVTNHPQTHRFLGAELKKEPFGSNEWIDTEALAWPFYHAGMIPGRSLWDLAVFFAVGADFRDDADGVADQCTTLVQVYSFMMARYKTALLGEEAVREVGGSALTKALKWVGL